MIREDVIRDYCQRGFSLVPFQAVRPGPGETKWKKKPLVSWEDRQRQAVNIETVLSEFRRFPDSLIGCCTGTVSGICNLDVDDDEGRALVDELVSDSLLVPTYKTISGGLQMIFRAPTPCPAGAVRFLPGLDFRGQGSCTILPPSDLGYDWLPGLSLQEVNPPTVPEPLLKKINIYTYRGRVDASVDSADFFTPGRRNEDLFTVANAMVKQNLPEKLVMQAINMLAQKCNPPFPLHEVETIIRSATERAAGRDRNLSAEVREWVLSTSGNFMSTDVAKCQQLSTRSEMQNLSMILKRLCDERVIERYGNKNGCFRRIENDIEFMDFANANIENTVDLRLPLGLQTKTSIYPKGVIVGAGVSGTGKTLFALNAVADNMDRFPAFYFNSEMGPEALKKKLSHFPISIDKWVAGMKVADRWDFNNIADKVQPDAFNVVDYLEPDGERPYNIHGVISAIIRRLNKGTALIMIQKKPGATMGTGGIYSIKAASLAFSLDWGRLEIVKNRFREADPLPSCNKISFEVHQGWKFVEQGGWYK